MKPPIIRFALCFLAISCLSQACIKKPKDDEPKFYTKVKMDGTWLSLTGAKFKKGPDPLNSYLNNFSVETDSDDHKTYFSIAFQVVGEDIKIGTYSTPDNTIQVTYIEGLGSDFKMYQNSKADGRPEPHFTITISSLSNEEARGHFSGGYILDLATKKVIEITEGEFVATRIP